MKLQELLKGVAVLSSTADGEAEIGEVRYDSRAVGKGDLFVAIRGYATDGHKYIEKALEQGAAAVVCEEAPEGVPAVVVENSRKALAEIAANRFGHPADSMVMLGVTGTNGKTTTTYLVKHMLEDAGHKVGLIGTNQNLIGSEVIETHHARVLRAARAVRAHARRRLHPCHHGGLLALARARPRARHPLCGRRVHQSDTGPSGLP